MMRGSKPYIARSTSSALCAPLAAVHVERYAFFMRSYLSILGCTSTAPQALQIPRRDAINVVQSWFRACSQR